jgi:hypothetical protein
MSIPSFGSLSLDIMISFTLNFSVINLTNLRYKFPLKSIFIRLAYIQIIKNDCLTHKRNPRGRQRVEIVLIMYIKLLLMLFSFNLSGCAHYTQCVTKIRHNACHYIFLVSRDEMSPVHDTRLI